MTQTISKAGVKYAITRSAELRDAGYENETRDCFVQAVKYVTGVPYRDAHAFVAVQFNRKARKGTCHVKSRMQRAAINQETIFGYRVFDKTPKPRIIITRSRRTFAFVQKQVWPTVAESMLALRVGRYIVCSGNHAWAVIDGVIHDNGVTGNRTRVTECYELIPSSQCGGQ